MTRIPGNDRKLREMNQVQGIPGNTMNSGKSQEITGNHRKSQEIPGNSGKSQEITGNSGEFREITGNPRNKYITTNQFIIQVLDNVTA